MGEAAGGAGWFGGARGRSGGRSRLVLPSRGARRWEEAELVLEEGDLLVGADGREVKGDGAAVEGAELEEVSAGHELAVEGDGGGVGRGADGVEERAEVAGDGREGAAGGDAEDRRLEEERVHLCSLAPPSLCPPLSL